MKIIPGIFLMCAGLGAASLTCFAAIAGSTPSGTAEVETPVFSSDKAVQASLAELGRLLDSDPKFEQAFQSNIEHLEDNEFRKNNPRVDVLLTQQPGLISALKTERHFLIHRYIAHHARGPLLRPDIVALDRFLTKHADLRKALDERPSEIVESAFLAAHPALTEFFNQHAALSTVLFEDAHSRNE